MVWVTISSHLLSTNHRASIWCVEMDTPWFPITTYGFLGPYTERDRERLEDCPLFNSFFKGTKNLQPNGNCTLHNILLSSRLWFRSGASIHHFCKCINHPQPTFGSTFILKPWTIQYLSDIYWA